MDNFYEGEKTLTARKPSGSKGRKVFRELLFSNSTVFPVVPDHGQNASDFMPTTQRGGDEPCQKAQRQGPPGIAPGRTPLSGVKSRQKIAADQQRSADNSAEDHKVLQ